MKYILSSIPLLLALSSSAIAQVTPIVTETFEYPIPGVFHGMTGGTGFSNAWFVSGGANDELQVTDNTTAPAFSLSDGIGGHAEQVVTWGAAYRQLDLAAHPELIDPATNMWGRDGSAIYVSFSAVAFQGAPTEHFGGLSLWKAGQTQPEAIFLGSPWEEPSWGFDDEGPVGGPSVVVPGSDDTVATRLVYRIDFMPGDERLQLWLNPATPYPTNTADLDAMIVDMRFDEIRLSTGGNNGDLFQFDAIEIAKVAPSGSLGVNYCSANVNSTGATATVEAVGSDIVSLNDVTLGASQMPGLAFGFFIVSQTQGFAMNPGGSSGNLCLAGSVGRYVGPGQIQQSNLAGTISLPIDLNSVPQPLGFVSIAPGDTWNFQVWFRDSDPGGMPTSNFTDGVEVTFQ